MTNLWSEIVKSSRPISWINTAFPFAAGYIVATRYADWRLLVGSFYFLIPYNIMLYGINDIFDYESDMRNPRKGGVEGAVLARKYHKPLILVVIATNLPFVIALMFAGGLSAGLTLLAVIATVLAYSVPVLRFKERPILDSLTSSSHFVGPLVYGLVLTGWHHSYWPFVAAFFLWGIASHAFGAVQDIIADREAKIGSIATVFGASWTSRFALLFYLLSAGLLFAQGLKFAPVGGSILLYAFCVAPYINLSDRNAEKANNGWKQFLKLNQLTGFVVTVLIILTLRHTI